MSDRVKISKSKLNALASAFRVKMETSDTLTLQEMITAIPELVGVKYDSNSGTYDSNGNMIKSWKQLIDDGDIIITNPVDGVYLLKTPSNRANRFANVKKIVIDSSVTILTTDSNSQGTFMNCKNLTSIVIPNSVTEISNGTFEGCSSLPSIIIPNSVTKIGSKAFQNCTSLTSVTIPSSVTTIYSFAFVGCSALTSIDIPNSVKSIGNNTFKDCTNLTTIYYSGTATGAPWGATNATVVQPGTYDANGNLLKSWAKVIEDGDLVIDDVFRTGDLYLVKSLEGDDTPTRFANVSKVVIGPGMVGLHSHLFTNCSNLVEVVIPNGVKYIGTTGDFDAGVFAGCTNLTTVRIPNSVEEIYVPAFYNCTSLTEITIPNSVNYIEGAIFYGCTNLTTIHYSGTVTGAPWGAENATVVP